MAQLQHYNSEFPKLLHTEGALKFCKPKEQTINLRDFEKLIVALIWTKKEVGSITTCCKICYLNSLKKQDFFCLFSLFYSQDFLYNTIVLL